MQEKEQKKEGKTWGGEVSGEFSRPSRVAGVPMICEFFVFSVFFILSLRFQARLAFNIVPFHAGYNNLDFPRNSGTLYARLIHPARSGETIRISSLLSRSRTCRLFRGEAQVLGFVRHSVCAVTWNNTGLPHVFRRSVRQPYFSPYGKANNFVFSGSGLTSGQCLL